MTDPILAVEGLEASYGESQVLRGMTLDLQPGEVASLIGRNGAGKTTTLRSISGVLRPVQGHITFDGEDITDLPAHAITSRGVSYVPEDRQVFPELTVEENLQMGSIGTDDALFTREEVFDRFPRLRERRDYDASHLSGGEQQMLAIARAVVGRTRLLLLDEPTEGLAPKIVEDVIEVINDLREASGVTILLVEQNLRVALEVADRHYVMNKGRVTFEGSTGELEAAEEVQRRDLGVGMT